MLSVGHTGGGQVIELGTNPWDSAFGSWGKAVDPRQDVAIHRPTTPGSRGIPASPVEAERERALWDAAGLETDL